MNAGGVLAERDREEAIRNAALRVLARDGIGGVTMRAVAREANVSLGLAHYYFADKTALMSAVLRNIGELDLTIVNADTTQRPAEALRVSLARAFDPAYLTPTYLALRLHLWSLASVDPVYADINRTAQRRYLSALTSLIKHAVPGLRDQEAQQRAREILVVQNGVWLTSAIIDDTHMRDLGRTRCEEIAFAPKPVLAARADSVAPTSTRSEQRQRSRHLQTKG